MSLKENKTLIFGLGNPILSDDGVGIRVAKMLKENLDLNKNIDVKWGSLSGLKIIDEIMGYDKVILIDAVKMGGDVGKLHRFQLSDFRKAIYLTSPHTMNIPTAIQIGINLKIKMPKEIIIYGIEVKEIQKFGSGLSRELEEKLHDIFKIIIKKTEAIYDNIDQI